MSGGGLYNSDFLLTWQHREETLGKILQTARVLEDLARAGVATRAFDSGLGISIFRDNSTRTRYAFRSACNLLGLMTEELDESTSQIAHGETVRETVTMISFLTEVVGIRDDLFLGEGHKYQTEVAAALEESHKEGVLMQRPAVINLQSDLDHPTQSMADLLHLVTHFGGLDALKGKKLAMSWAYSPSYGKPLSVPQGIITLMTRFGMDVVLAYPPGYDLVDETVETARRFATESGGSFTTTDSMAAAFENADVVYPKSWAPIAIMRQRTRQHTLEKEALAMNAQHRDWECTDQLMRATRHGKALYMHCLPADVTDVSCAAGEVSKSVFERARLDTYREASHKPFIIAAMVLLTRFEDPSSILSRFASERRPKR
jgi:knotted carbamoyltransferase YgeW